MFTQRNNSSNLLPLWKFKDDKYIIRTKTKSKMQWENSFRNLLNFQQFNHLNLREKLNWSKWRKTSKEVLRIDSLVRLHLNWTNYNLDLNTLLFISDKFFIEAFGDTSSTQAIKIGQIFSLSIGLFELLSCDISYHLYLFKDSFSTRSTISHSFSFLFSAQSSSN